VTVAVTRCSIAVVAAIVVGGCSGGEEPGKVFTLTDVARIGSVRPVTPGWNWPTKQDKREAPDSQVGTQADPNDVLLVELNKQTADLVEIGTGGGRWKDNEKLANLSVTVFGSASDAHELMAPLNDFSRGWGKVGGRITKNEEIDGLGDEAWRLWSDGSGTQVTYHWRRGNLLVEAHVHCFGYCPGNVDAATRAWVDAIDEAARAGS
jgi:hypothetical protein